MKAARRLAFLGHHRCASSWVKGILDDICRELNLVTYTHTVGRMDERLLATLQANGAGFVYCTNATRSLADQLDCHRGFHVVRDPRDVVVSAYFSHKNSHKLGGWLTQEYRDQLVRLSEEEGILMEMERRAHQFRAMAEWDYANPAVLELRMEDMTADPGREFSRTLKFLGILAEDESGPGLLTKSGLAAILDRHSFQAKTGGRHPGQENPGAHYRKGVHGDWVNHFRPAHVKYFKARHNDLLLKLGYEHQADW